MKTNPIHMTRFIAAAIGSLLLLGACLGPGQIGLNLAPQKTRPPDDSFLPTVYDTRSFSLKAPGLPPMYIGHNPELVYKNIMMRYERSARDPHESDAQYRARIGQEINSPLVGSLDFDSVYAFRMTPAKMSYNSGAGQMTVRCALSRAFQNGAENPINKAFVVRRQPLLDNRYTVTLAGGSKRIIEEVKFNEYAVSPAGAIKNATDISGEYIVTSFAASPDEARRAEGNVMALLVGTLSEPYASYEQVIRKPTAEAPGSYEARYHYIHLKLLEVWFYDVKTGKILKKLTLD